MTEVRRAVWATRSARESPVSGTGIGPSTNMRSPVPSRAAITTKAGAPERRAAALRANVVDAGLPKNGTAALARAAMAWSISIATASPRLSAFTDSRMAPRGAIRPMPLARRLSTSRALKAPRSGRTTALSLCPRRDITSANSSQLPKCALATSSPFPAWYAASIGAQSSVTTARASSASESWSTVRASSPASARFR
jgi:hypothetical protein